MATVGDFTDAERAMAQRRLKTWIPQVDPANRARVDAYLLAKMKNARVSVQQVLQIIQEQELSVSSSQSQESRFYVVARTNFPKGLTLEQQKWLVTKQELESRYELRDDNTDYEQMYVFHDACPRAGLGKWANTLRLSLKMSRTSREPRPAASSHSLTAAGEANRASSTENDGAESSEPVPPADKKNAA